MSQSNTGLIRSMYDAFAQGDIPYVLGLLDPQAAWHEAENFVYADRSPYIGPQAVLEGVFMRLGGEWENFGAAVEEILSDGDTVIVLGRYHGTCRATGVAVNAQFVHVYRLQNGRIVHFRQYTDTAQFRDAVNAPRSAGA